MEEAFLLLQFIQNYFDLSVSFCSFFSGQSQNQGKEADL